MLPTKRKSDGTTDDGTIIKHPKPGSEDKGMTDNDFDYYSPSEIFKDIKSDGKANASEEMAGSKNFNLARSFYLSRYTDEGQLRSEKRGDRFDRNAGAVQLYKKDGVTVYTTTTKDGKVKEYNFNFVSYGNKEFKTYTKREFYDKSSAYGHSERVLMKKALDEVISDLKGETRPSDCELTATDDHEKEYQILRNLSDPARAGKYREYLEKNEIIVKMWSERPSCAGVGAGGGCSSFMKTICPRGSKFGFIVKDYRREDNQGGAPKVEKAFDEFKTAYENKYD